tara:strand:- start:49355 stop:50206 length:852 start_codon:yes stop_codon:yes gene_type:complete
MNQKISKEEFFNLKSTDELKAILVSKGISTDKIAHNIAYQNELELLQIELVKLQQWIVNMNKKVLVIFEGRDAAGKGGSIRRFVEHLNPRSMRVVALTKPSEKELGQWYFSRYVKELPQPGEIVFFDRSWYNRAVVEPVMKFCTPLQYDTFMNQVPEFEQMLQEEEVHIIKFWFSISKEVQKSRFDARKTDPLKLWKISPVDEKSQGLWNEYTHFKEEMFSKTHSAPSPWIIVQANTKKTARLESIRYLLSQFEYTGKDKAKTIVTPDPNIVSSYKRSIHSNQ